MKLLNVIPYSEITKAIEREALNSNSPWFSSREEFEEWSGDVLDCIVMEILDSLGIEYDTGK